MTTVPVDPGSTASLAAADVAGRRPRHSSSSQRPDLTEGADPEAGRDRRRGTRRRGCSARLEQSLELVRRGAGTAGLRTDTGWPRAAIRRAG